MRPYIVGIFWAVMMAVAACGDTHDVFLPSGPDDPDPEVPVPGDPGTEPGTDPGNAGIDDPAAAYVWDESVIPEIRVSISREEWNALLARYDEFPSNADYFHCDVSYIKGDEVTEITDAGIRLRGNTSRRRPEGQAGQVHGSGSADWHHCHFGINFRKFNKDDAHTVKGIRKVNLKWFKDDPSYVRELYCYDLFRRAGVWTAPLDTYCRLWIHVKGDQNAAYYGVYEMIEPVDERYVKRRVDGMFANAGGNLWKCGWDGSGAFLNTADASFGLDENTGKAFNYEYKGEAADYDAAVGQFKDFIYKLCGKSDESFTKWIKEVCDVELLLKTYAVNVAVGMWDDHWNNGNNFYLYFNSKDKYDYKVFFIPYDYDNTLGTSSSCGIISDSGRHDPFNWGDSGLLMERMMKIGEFRDIYAGALAGLIDSDGSLFCIDASIARIKAWQKSIAPYVSNDTGEDMGISDSPAWWGNHSEYRLTERGGNNFFSVRASAIRSAL